MRSTNPLPLEGLVVVDMSQFLSGPYCSLRMLDLGARVIKIERPDGGDLSRLVEGCFHGVIFFAVGE